VSVISRNSSATMSRLSCIAVLAKWLAVNRDKVFRRYSFLARLEMKRNGFIKNPVGRQRLRFLLTVHLKQFRCQVPFNASSASSSLLIGFRQPLHFGRCNLISHSGQKACFPWITNAAVCSSSYAGPSLSPFPLTSVPAEDDWEGSRNGIPHSPQKK
jgi:hypothetical protein